jgi:hypothetical protein
MWHKEQLVKFDDIREQRGRGTGQSSSSDDDQGLTMAEAVESWENSLKFSGSTQDQMRAVYQLVVRELFFSGTQLVNEPARDWASSQRAAAAGEAHQLQPGNASLFARRAETDADPAQIAKDSGPGRGQGRQVLG